MVSDGGLIAYVTSHGFGHLNRTVAVLNRIPDDVPLTIRCHSDLFDHWRERLRRPAELEPHVSDSGAVNPPGDSAATDAQATLERASVVYEQAWAQLDEEVERIRSSRARAVLCDVPPLPLVAARRAGVPAYALANFSWAEIYAPHARKLGPKAVHFVAALRRAYRQATLLFRASPGLVMREFRHVIDVGMVVTAGRDRRGELRQEIGLSEREKLVYFYVGRYGQADMGWERLERMSRQGIHFVGFHPAPTGPIPNLHVISPDRWTGADLAASADAIIAKAGYGTVCEAMAARTPMIYPPRVGFAEHRALDKAMRAWGGGLPSASRAFRELRLENLIQRALALRPGAPPFAVDGAERVADHLADVCAGRRQD